MRLANDRLLLERAQHFDADALAEIFDCYNASIYRYALRLLGDPDLARECMSETFSRFLHALQRGAGPNEYLQAYLYRIAHNWITDYYRSKPPPSLPLDPEMRIDPAEEPPHLVGNELEIQQVRSALALLTPEQRQAITLKFLEEWNNEEIAQAMNRPIGAVKALQHRAIQALRRLLCYQAEVDYD
jgi:RNA polymerase sigma-70 factor (ECF subfamily)